MEMSLYMPLWRLSAYALVFVASSLMVGSCTKAGDDFPPVDPAKVRITLERSACYGTCPDYKVTIYGDGRVSFTTGTEPTGRVLGSHRQFAVSQGVLLPGTHEDRIAPEAVAALVEKFRAAGFFRLKSEYQAGVTDNPTYVLSFDTGRKSMTVLDYVGREAGMPEAVTDLENAVDALAGTDRWVRGSKPLIAWLEQQQFDFRSLEAAQLALAALDGKADEATVLALIDHGAPLEAAINTGESIAGEPPKREPVGQRLLQAAISRGKPNLFRKLVASGWLERLGKQRIGEDFAQNAAGCSPALVDAAAQAGINIDQPAPIDSEANTSEAQGKTALAELATSYGCRGPGREASRLATARRLLALGANPNHRDSMGRTAIYGVQNLDLLNLLLNHGADAKVNDNEGKSMVFGSWLDPIVARLLEAGASPVGRYDIDGKRTLVQAAQNHMPKVAQWLATHPEALSKQPVR